jgi:diguanylate cyclase (GGDEF)-like protein
MVRILPIRLNPKTLSKCVPFPVIFLLAASAFALDPSRAITQYVQSAWTTDSGLPQNSIHAIAQTSDGYLWLGTEEGLTRFDGLQFTTWTHSNAPGLPSEYIQALAAGPDGTLWIGTDSGLTVFRPDLGGGPNGAFSDMSARAGLSGKNVNALWWSSQDGLWVGTETGLVCIHASGAPSWQASGRLATAAVRSISADRGGATWVGTNKGLFRIEHGSVQAITTRDGLPDDSILSLAAARDGSMWVGTLNGGLAQIHQGRVSIPRLRLPSRAIQSLLVDRNDALWIGFDRRGIGRLYSGKLDLYGNAQGLPSDRCTHAMLEDREGSLWIGLLDAGLLQLRDGKFAVFGKPEGLSGNYIGNVLQALDGSIWVGADSNGLNHIFPDGRVEVWNSKNGLPAQAVYSFFQARDQSLWVGFRNGSLCHIKNHRVTVYVDPDAVDVSLNSIFEDREGHLWVGFWGKGLAQFARGKFRHIGPPERIAQITQSPDGALWIATDGSGLERLSAGSSTRFDIHNGLPSDHVMCVYADNEGFVWVGTATGGISRIHRDQIVSWTVPRGLPETTVGSIIGDNNGNLWFGGDRGIYRVTKQELNQSANSPAMRIHPVHYGNADGLRSHETLYGSTPCAWKGRDGRIWFATIRGAAVIDPARMAINSVAPPAWIERILFDSRQVSFHNGVRLGPGSGNLEITFTAPSFVAPQLVRVRYRLVGFEPDWVDAGSRRSAWYTNLAPGHYTFLVQAQNSDGLWSDQPASFQFTLLAPWFQTSFAYAAYALLAILLVWGIIRYRTHVLVQRHAELTRIVAERTAQLQTEKAALEAARRELQIQATHDSLTGIHNRAAILEHLNREIARSVRDRTPSGVVIADLDHFKNVNDQYGHLCGDQVLRQCADRFRNALRGYDVVGRYGGEEFLLLFPGWDASNAPNRMNDLLRAIGCYPFTTRQSELSLTCSLGVACFNPDSDAPDPLDVLHRADAALYVAKNAGRNCARFEIRRPSQSPDVQQPSLT